MVSYASDVKKELVGIQNYENKLSIKQKNIIKFNLPIENSLRTLISYKKLKVTNLKYPRRYNEIKNKEI